MWPRLGPLTGPPTDRAARPRGRPPTGMTVMRMPATAGSGSPAGDGPADGPAGTSTETAPQARGRPGAAAAMLRRHWLITALLLAGLVLRGLSMAAYQPALLYIDSLKYLFGAWPGNDPLGYNLVLKVLLIGGNLDTVTTLQHLLGLAMAVVLYMLLVRRGAPRWLSALAAAPVLLDAYQVQIEQTIMPDVWFEALIVAGLALLLWRPEPGPRLIVAGGLALGASAPVAQVGQILILPALVYLLIVVPGWRRKLIQAVLLCAAFALPIIGFSLREYVVTHQFSLAPAAGSTIYGRLAESADCATLKLPPYERAVCPPRALAIRLGPDGLVHSATSPDHTYVAPPGRTHGEVIGNFEHRVITQQPLRVVAGVLGDAARLFEVHRVTSTGDTPISRWQFQTSYPTYDGSIFLSRDHTIMLGLHFASSGGPVQVRPLPAAMGGRATVARPLAGFLRGYQLHGGYTPGPLLAFAALAGLAGAVIALAGGLAAARGRSILSTRQRELALACLLVFGSAVAVLLASDLFEFSWRYQLPALVTLPPAGALGLALLGSLLRRRSPAGHSQGRNENPPADSPVPARSALAGPHQADPVQADPDQANPAQAAPAEADTGLADTGRANPGQADLPPSHRPLPRPSD
jgi:hypothetical protein